MELEKLNIPTNKVDQFKRAGITSIEDLVCTYPRRYVDRTTLNGLQDGGESVFLFDCEKVQVYNNRSFLIEATGKLAGTQVPVRICWFSQYYLYNTIAATKGHQMLVAGTAKYVRESYGMENRYEISSPSIYEPASLDALKIYPQYKKVKGMADDYYIKQLQAARTLLGHLEETIPADIIARQGLLSHDEMVSALHNPKSQQELDQATTRKRWDDLLYFALRIEMNNRKVPNGSTYGLPALGDMNRTRDNLPFTLTQSQSDALDAAITHIRTGRRLNALIQGDVGCGKTIIAQLLMIAFASNGYQAAIMAPTQLLAKQHYEGLQKLCEPLNIPVVFIGGGKLGKKAQAKMEASLRDGTYRLIVGTQALLEEKYQFKNLALVVEDEEHKYGVLQRAALTEKAAGGTHTITMSATPIPRSLAQTIYGDTLQLFTITEKPAGRKPVLTGIAPDEYKAIAFLKRICKLGQQAYVVCPMVAANEKVEGVASAEEIFRTYNSALSPEGIQVAVVTGKTNKKQAAEILEEFEKGNISVLVSTTIIEVGINVPNASCMIIHNAERFGLAQLHQLRGRVGRGSNDAFCSLISQDSGNPRLQAMVKTNDGFEIAKSDLEQRGAGDFLGVQQSGTERYLGLALSYTQEYQAAQTAARDILDRGERCYILDKAEADREEQKGGEIL